MPSARGLRAALGARRSAPRALGKRAHEIRNGSGRLSEKQPRKAVAGRWCVARRMGGYSGSQTRRINPDAQPRASLSPSKPAKEKKEK